MTNLPGKTRSIFGQHRPNFRVEHAEISGKTRPIFGQNRPNFQAEHAEFSGRTIQNFGQYSQWRLPQHQHQLTRTAGGGKVTQVKNHRRRSSDAAATLQRRCCDVAVSESWPNRYACIYAYMFAYVCYTRKAKSHFE